MSKKLSNYILMFYVAMMLVIGVSEIFLNYFWTSTIAHGIFAIVIAGVTVLVCLSLPKCDKRIEYLVYVLMGTILMFTGSLWLFISGAAVLLLSTKHIRSLSKIIIMMGTISIISMSVLFGLNREELINLKVLDEQVSPNGEHKIQQLGVDAHLGGSGNMINMHRDILNVLDVSYRVQLNDVRAEIIWIDDESFSIDGEVKDVVF